MGYSPNTPDDIRDMLAAIGAASVEELFAPIPAQLRAKSFDLPPGMSELELMRLMREKAASCGAGITPFIGGGIYDHFIPAAVDHLASRAEFYTAYTPYQPECAQGTLQALYEYQTTICRLTGLEASNASLYDGGTAVAEAALMSLRITDRHKVILDGSVNPLHREIVTGYLHGLSAQAVQVASDGCASDLARLIASIDDETAAVIVQSPNFFGSVQDFRELAQKAHDHEALLIVSCYPIAMGLVASPGEMGADIAVGEGQSLGNHLSFGGPYFGFIATRKRFIRNLPGRIVGETVDHQGRRGFVLTLQAREQHIKRHKATSNICSNQSLCALRGLIFCASLGRKGFEELARLNYDKAQYARSVLGAVRGVEVLNAGATFNEFTLSLPKDAAEVVQRLLDKGVAAGVPLGQYYPGMERALVVTVTEKRTRDEIDRLAALLEEALWS
ncbi:aminomethyl-transferring glycine dehydrogenase subunit GcvPA [Geomonas subterranea]|uniref:Probable glycine dehydrogenase (decarboxylating) subunit 1 n=1 Tax=Geomonas subterranea TaxID=2847989 RepID=A0ABX8LD81_9BACT|nr:MULTISPECIES: aminomethyl-transferring glycine dehydrogenase subunit GcvPA [Geomonas]QXE89612.1 aminomethyl-transferring glycine dehydrogenase subunit GcvPA [Geomonas subterranea]QXM08272.1 aminomethyl-transferring glycine dehydrogenase subunit GcvPA [Geomonas subterranea]